jgi:putative transposase
MTGTHLRISISRLCERVGMSRQNYYKQRAVRSRKAVDEDLVIQLVRRERQQQSRIGTRKLHHILSDDFREAGVEIGRDRMFEILRNHDLLVEPLPKSPRTTNSRHSLPVFRNLIAELTTTGPNQIWASDLTYIRTLEGFEYLSLSMDLHSRKIVGFHCGDNLSTAGCLAALDQALADVPEDCHPIHHSDRGCQYCSHDYIQRLTDHGLTPSMTEENHCAENATAERLNGILKQEYGLGWTFQTRAQVHAAVEQAVWLYNNRRPHTSLQLKTPVEVHAKAA